MKLVPLNRTLLFTRNHPKDKRLGDLVYRWDGGEPLEKVLQENSFAIVGWADDLGIQKNKGRTGAKEGPDAIRSAFYKCTPGFDRNFSSKKIIDLGNLDITTEIWANHERAAEVVSRMIQKNVIPICLGGGNDYAFADLLGVRKALGPKPTLGVINIDSHFDVRDLADGPTSGTPYFQALENNLMRGEHFVEFGIQPLHNSPDYHDYVAGKKVRVVTLEQIQTRGAKKLFFEQLQFLKQTCDTIVVSLDIDSVCQADAPGSSAPYPNGLSARDIEEISAVAGDEGKVKLFSIYEVSPPFDRDGQTAMLAASAIWNFITSR